MKKIICGTAILMIIFNQNIFAQSTDSESLIKVLTAYLDLKNALTNDNGDSARASGKKLFNAISDVQAETLTAEHKKAWLKYYEKLSYDAGHIKTTDDIEHQREHFSKLSANMYKLLGELKINATDLYYQFCSMAKDNKGAYWLSEQAALNNPYMGKKMPRCGMTKDTIISVK